MISINLCESEVDVIIASLKYHRKQIKAKKTDGKLNYIDNIIDMFQYQIDKHDIAFEEAFYG